MNITCSMAGFWFDLKVTVFSIRFKTNQPSIHPSIPAFSYFPLPHEPPN